MNHLRQFIILMTISTSATVSSVNPVFGQTLAVQALTAGGELGAGRDDRANKGAWSQFGSKIALGTNANAVLALDLIADGGAGNRRDDGVTTGAMSGRGTKIAVEVFATGVATSLRGMVLRFAFDASLVRFVKAENSAFALAVPEGSVGVNLASLSPVTLATSGFLARAEFETVADVTGREFSIGIERVTIAENLTSSDDLRTSSVIRFNAMPSPDFDGDGMVGFSDFLAFAGSFGSSQGDSRFEARFDLDGNGAVVFSDFLIFASAFGTAVETPTRPETPSGHAPVDQAAFDALFRGKQVVWDSNNRLIFLSPGRLREIEDGVSYDGDYEYINTGLNTGTFTYTYDVSGNDPEIEKTVGELTFTSANAGTFVSTYTERGLPPEVLRGSFELVDFVSERAALVALYEATDGANWVYNTNWLSDRPMGEWYGVKTDSAGSVTHIQLYTINGDEPVRDDPISAGNTKTGNGLSGRIPPELGNLSNLQRLSLNYNALTDSIPHELGNLRAMRRLDLDGNRLTGSIPVELGNLTNLEGLDLSGNQLTGVIPVELGNLTNLRLWLFLHNNQLTGSIPAELGNLTNLRGLNLGGNQLTGPIPAGLGRLANLGWLFLSGNQLTGCVPSELREVRYNDFSALELPFCQVPPTDDADSLNAGPIRRLTFMGGSNSDPAWSPDGRHIAFSSNLVGSGDIYVMDADGGNPRRLTNNGQGNGEPSWSPDGRYIAFQSSRDGNREIYVMGANGRNPRRLTNNDASDEFPAWSPDGRHIIFSSDRHGSRWKYQIYLMDADGSNPRRLTNNDASEARPAWSPDGLHIAFPTDRDGGGHEIYVMDADGSNPRRLTNNGQGNGEPSWSPDGRHIAFSSSDEIFVMDSEGGNRRRLIDYGYSVSSPAWSPDGRHIAFVSMLSNPGHANIYVMELQVDTGGGGSGSADLVIQSPSVDDNTLTTGQSFTLSATVRNQGNASSGVTTLRYYRSSTATISTDDVEVGTDAVSGLAAGGTSAESISLNAPSNAGTYYYGACVDGVSGESNTDNNCSSGVSVSVSSGSSGGGDLGACRSGLVVNPGSTCTYKGQTFSVSSSGQGAIAFFRAGNSIDARGSTINGVRWNFHASKNSGSNAWTIHTAD